VTPNLSRSRFHYRCCHCCRHGSCRCSCCYHSCSHRQKFDWDASIAVPLQQVLHPDDVEWFQFILSFGMFPTPELPHRFPENIYSCSGVHFSVLQIPFTLRRIKPVCKSSSKINKIYFPTRFPPNCVLTLQVLVIALHVFQNRGNLNNTKSDSENSSCLFIDASHRLSPSMYRINNPWMWAPRLTTAFKADTLATAQLAIIHRFFFKAFLMGASYHQFVNVFRALEHHRGRPRRQALGNHTTAIVIKWAQVMYKCAQASEWINWCASYLLIAK